MPNWVEPPLPPAIALIISGTSTPARHAVPERPARRQAREHDVALGADLGRRARRHAADLLEFGERRAAKANHATAAFDQVFGNRHADPAQADKTDGFHERSPAPMPGRWSDRNN